MLTLAILAQEKGGTGKTTTATHLNAACEAGGRKTTVIDVDDGNSGYIRTNGKESALALPWETPATEARQWSRHLDASEVAIFDLGANLFASGAPVTHFLAEVVTHFKDQGAKIVCLPVAAPSAPGCDRLVAFMHDNFGSMGEVRIVENDVDGSGAFPKTLATIGLPRIKLRHIDSGLQAARLLRIGEPLLQVLRDPPEGYRLAMAKYAEILLRFAEQDTVADIVGDRALGPLRELAKAAPKKLRYTLTDLASVADQKLKANGEYARTFNALMSSRNSDVSDIYTAAVNFIDAANDYSKC